MAVQFFFKDPKEDNMGEILSSGLKAGQEFRQASIKRDLDAAYNQHVVTEPQYDAAGNVTARPGDLNASGFIKSAQEAGLPMEESMKYLAHQKAIRDAQLDTATTESMIRSAGYDPSPSVTGRAGAPIGNPATTQEQAYLKTADNPDKSSLEDWFAGIQKPAAAQAPVAPTAEEIAANDRLVNGLRNPSEVGPKTPAQGGVSYADVAKTLGIGGAPQVSADGSQMDLGSGVIQGQGPVEKPVEEAKMSAPEAWNSYVPQPLQKDTRTAGQAVQDTYQEPKSEGVGVGVDQAEANGEFAWSPVDDNSSAFRKYKTTLDSRLKGAGMVDAEGNASPSMLLKKLYTATYNQNLSAKPDQRLIALGAEGRKKYLEMDAEYKASQIKAAGLASKAVLDARQKLSEEANTYGVQTIAGKTEARTAEKHEADMGGRRAGNEAGSEIIRLRAVSEAEKTRGEAIANSYLDLKASKKLGGFEGDYAGAMARAKADGNVNSDVITGHLISMGAFPSEKAAYIKQMLSTAPQSAWDAVVKKMFAEIGNKFYTEHAKRDAWYKASEDNMKDAMKLVGYGVLEKPSKERTAKDDLEDALGKGKGKSKRASKNWTSKPDGTQQVGDTYKGHTLGTDGKWH